MMCFGLSTINDLQAQSVSDPATFAFDIRLGRMRDGEMMSSPAMAGMMNQPGAMGPGMSPSDIDRVFGAVALPNDMATFEVFNQPQPPAELPMNFFARIELANASVGDTMWADISGSPGVSEEVINGTTYLANEGEMTNILVQRINDVTIEIATRDFVQAGIGRELFSPGLTDAWGKVPDHALRLAIDLQGEAQLVSEVIAMAKQDPSIDPMSSAYLDLVDNAANVRFSFDPDDTILLQLAATGVDASQAEELRSGIDAALGIAKMGGTAALNMAENNPEADEMTAMLLSDPNMMSAARGILGSLSAKSEGNEVMVTIPRPDGFTEAVSSLMEVLPMMMMGGMGGPPPGDFGPGDFGPGDFGPGDFDQFEEGGDLFGGSSPVEAAPFGGGEEGDPFGGG